jgi:hypothetical protein
MVVAIGSIAGGVRRERCVCEVRVQVGFGAPTPSHNCIVLCCVVENLIIDLSAYAEDCRPGCEIVVWSGGIADGG